MISELETQKLGDKEEMNCHVKRDWLSDRLRLELETCFGGDLTKELPYIDKFRVLSSTCHLTNLSYRDSSLLLCPQVFRLRVPISTCHLTNLNVR